ncbi:GAF and ANTAR domain-containing protein [Micromonospora cremea]|uniref:GAF domain-containing protein n=1 Tax=Micromonospora cremea TaxID=709881 RepID=A0A1N5U7A6_9ACTN|nr:GAF and ANTAR domain-containing protein [Micromonospora cremea]SIM56135.1 GAF domain-containing protein [Micromonospora cremea]
MNSDRRIRLWTLVVDVARGGTVAVEHVCAASVAVAGVDSAAVAVTLRATPREMLCASDRTASELEDLTLTLGEGPCVDAITGGPHLVADLAAPECLARWPAFAPAAVRAGVRAVFALPLQVGGIRLGVLDLYRARSGGLDGEQLTDALVLADTACAVLLDGARPDRHERWPEQAGLQHPEVHQATGMVTVQLGVTAAVALIRLRAFAYSHGRRLRDVAGDVVARRLRFDSTDDARDGGAG